MKNYSRRNFLKTLGVMGIAFSNIPAALAFSGRYSLFRNPLALPSTTGMLGVIDPAADFTLQAKKVSYELLPGKETMLWVYEADNAGALCLNPIIKVSKGSRFNATLSNALSESTIIHWHGLHVDAANDGHPADAIQPGDEYSYQYTIANRAGTYWYHTHAHGRTGKQVYYGLASFFIVEDDVERELQRTLDLEFGTTDIPLLVQDKLFDSSGDPVYYLDPMDSTHGFLGDTILVNHTYKPYLNVGTRIYRFRILNGSNSRIYRFAFIKNRLRKMPFYVIGNDGGFLSRPYQVSEIYMSPGERTDVLLDLSRSRPGDVVWLKSLVFNAMDETMGGGMMGGMPMMNQGVLLDNGRPFAVLKLNVTQRISFDKNIPEAFDTIPPIDTDGAQTRDFDLSFFMMRWFINGDTFDMDRAPVTVSKDSIEIWRIKNQAYNSYNPMPMMGMMSMPHPMHLHGFPFQVLARAGSPQHISRIADSRNGLLPTDRGYKDTVLIWPEETVSLAIDFSHSFSGDQRYLFHCHNLEHSDNGMMINYDIT